MTDHEPEALSASLEDYLEAILLLERESRVARVSDIADQLQVSRPSVTAALKNLAARGLVSHKRYGHATLTEEGTRIASEVDRRHVAIRDFLVEVLSIPQEKAESTACKLEHVLEPDVLAHFAAYQEAEESRRPGAKPSTALSDLPSGSHARVGTLPSHHGLARRLIALGLTPGSEVKVLLNRGRGPLIVEAHGARIALGRKQADRVTARLLDSTVIQLDPAEAVPALAAGATVVNSDG